MSPALLLLLACKPGALQFGDSLLTQDSPTDSREDSPVDSPTDSLVDSAVDSEDSVGHVPGATDPTEALFALDEIPTFDIELSAEALKSLESDPYTYVEGALVYGDDRYEPVGVRLKGENSFMPISQKAAFKVKMNKYVEGGNFMGLEELTFNNLASDPTFMHEYMGYRHFRELGIPAARSGFAQLMLNGEPYSFMTFVETVDKKFLKRWFSNPDGNLFEVWDVDFRDEYIPYFELEEGEEDRSMLQGLADALELSGEESYEAASEFLNWERFIDFWAAEMVVGQFDSYPYSNPGDDCHVYSDPDDGGRLMFIPHGMDETYWDPTRDILGINGRVGKRCLQVDACKEALIVRLVEQLEEADKIDSVGAYDAAVALVADYVAADKRKPYDASTVAYYQRAMHDFIDDRARTLARWTGG